MNTDASERPSIGFIGIGIVVKDHLGCVLVACARRVIENFEVETAEIPVLRDRLQLAANWSIPLACVESDSLSAIQGLRK